MGQPNPFLPVLRSAAAVAVPTSQPEYEIPRADKSQRDGDAWSYGDRYWAATTGAPYACYGPTTLHG